MCYFCDCLKPSFCYIKSQFKKTGCSRKCLECQTKTLSETDKKVSKNERPNDRHILERTVHANKVYHIDLRDVYAVYAIQYIYQNYKKTIRECDYTFLICLNIMVPVASILEATTFDNNTCKLIAGYLEYRTDNVCVQRGKYEKHRDLILKSDFFIFVTQHILNKYDKNKFIRKYLL